MEEKWQKQRPKERVMAANSYHATSPHVTQVGPWVVDLARDGFSRSEREGWKMKVSETMERRREGGQRKRK